MGKTRNDLLRVYLIFYTVETVKRGDTGHRKLVVRERAIANFTFRNLGA